MNHLNVGQEGENLAALEYEKLGFKIIGRNVRMHQARQVGEIDLIAVKNKLIVFVEVKTRLTKTFGEPEEAVNYFKQRKLIRAIKLFLLQRPQYDSWDWRVDVAIVQPKTGPLRVGIDKIQKDVTILVNVIEDFD